MCGLVCICKDVLVVSNEVEVNARTPAWIYSICKLRVFRGKRGKERKKVTVYICRCVRVRNEWKERERQTERYTYTNRK
uniref:Uncharacterized protein n=1 Tax=Octopus bimaculoides TaxID=37653 RepID=A0A0L8GFQ7_OCTBM